MPFKNISRLTFTTEEGEGFSPLFKNTAIINYTSTEKVEKTPLIYIKYEGDFIPIKKIYIKVESNDIQIKWL